MERLQNTLAYKVRSIRKRILIAINEIFAGTQFTWELYFVLRFIYENPGCSQKDIADLLWTDANIIVRNVDKLERMGMVNRQKHPADRRAYALYLTDEGNKTAEGYWEKLIAHQEACLSELSKEERASFKRYMDIVIGENPPPHSK